MALEPRDELDRLYDKLTWENPPANFSARLMARVQTAQRIQRISAIATWVALVALGVFAFALGRGLTFSGTLDFLVALASNLDVTLDTADAFVGALVDILPWTEIVAVVGSVVGIGLAAVVLPRILLRRQAGVH